MNAPYCTSLSAKQALRLALSSRRHEPADTVAADIYQRYHPAGTRSNDAVRPDSLTIANFFGIPLLGDRSLWQISLRCSVHH